MRRVPLFLLLFLLLPLGVVPVVGCRQTPRPDAAPGGAPAPSRTSAADILPDTDPRMLRFHRVDMLIAQWDVAQASTRTSQADALFQQIRNEVDGAFDDFVTASRGQLASRLQYVGVSALGFSSRREATQALLDRLADTDPDLVGNALIALKLRADPETPLAPLLKLAACTATAPRRYAPLAVANVVEARQRTGRAINPEMQRAAAHVLSGMVADRDAFVRLHVAKALGALRSPGTYELLMILMRDPEMQIRLAAAVGLERVGDPRGFPETIRLLGDAPDDVKPIVRDVLVSYARRLGDASLSPEEVSRLGSSPQAWSRWFADFAARRGIHLEEGRSAGAPPGIAGSQR